MVCFASSKDVRNLRVKAVAHWHLSREPHQKGLYVSLLAILSIFLKVAAPVAIHKLPVSNLLKSVIWPVSNQSQWNGVIRLD